MRRVQKAKPRKKIKETDAIPSAKLRTGFDHLNAVNHTSDEREDSLRISLDTKAKVDVFDSSRGGTLRGKEAVQTGDHNLGNKAKLVPFGILDVMVGLLTIAFGVSFETCDFIVDGLEHWWESNQDQYRHIRQLVINLDNAEQIQLSDPIYQTPFHAQGNGVTRRP